MKILELQKQYYENHANLKISLESYENHETLRIPFDNYAKNMKIIKLNKRIMKIMKII